MLRRKCLNIVLISLTLSLTDPAMIKADETKGAGERIQDLTCQVISDEHDIGSLLDPSDPSQFTCLITAYDGTVRPITSRNLRFLKDPSITSIEEARAAIKTEVPQVTSDFDREKMVYVKDGRRYGVSYHEDTGKYYYSRYSIRDICTCNDPTTSGLHTSFTMTPSEAGVCTAYVLLPDFDDITKSFVAGVFFHVRDKSGPVIDSVSANWIDENKGTYESSSFIGKGSKDDNNSLKLSVNAHDNVTGCFNENTLDFQWYRDGLELENEKKNELILEPLDDNNGIYYCKVTDENGNSSESESLNIANFDTMAPSADIKLYRPLTLADGTVTYETCGGSDDNPSAYKIISVDYDDLHLSDEPIAITKDTEDIPDAKSNLWTHLNRFMITESGNYRIYVRDLAGNIFSSDGIAVTGITPSAPVINAVLLEPQTDKKGNLITFNTQNRTKDSKDSSTTRSVPYMTVTVDASSNGSSEGLKYKLTIRNENGTEINVSAKDTADGFQVSPVFDHLTDDARYILYVKDPLDVVTSAGFTLNKDFYHAAGNNSSYIARMLLKPLSWTNKDISLGVSFTDSSFVDDLQSVSFDGGETWVSLTGNEAKLSVPANGTYEIFIKDKEGHIHRSGEQVIGSVDLEPPELKVSISDDNRSFNLKCYDDLSGPDTLCYTYKTDDGRLSDMMPINVFPKNDSSKKYDLSFNMTGEGIYTFYLYDAAGNVCKTKETNTDGVSVTVGNVALENPLFKGSDNETALKILEDISIDEKDLTKGPVSVLFSTLDTREFANNAYSWDDGVTFSDNRILNVTENGTYHLTIKDIYGNTYKSGDIVINNIDSLPPGLTLTQKDNKLIIDAYDLESGIDNISWKPSGSEEVMSLKDYDDVSSVKSMVSLPCNGAYTVYVTDNAGNTASMDKTVSNIINLDNTSGGEFEDIETNDIPDTGEVKGHVIEVTTEIEEPVETTDPAEGEIGIHPINFDNPTGEVPKSATPSGKHWPDLILWSLGFLILAVLAVLYIIRRHKKVLQKKQALSAAVESPPIRVTFEDEKPLE